MNLGTVGTVVVCLALLWFLYRLARAPRDLALRAVVACLAFQLVVTPLGNLAAAAEHGGSALPGLAKLTQNLAIADSWFSLMLFFLFSTSSSRRRAWHEFFVLLGATAVITLSMLATPAAARDHTFTGANMRIPGVAGFYLSAGCYFAYVLAQATRSALRYAGESNWRMRLGLQVASVGLALNAATCLIRAVFVIMRFSGGTVPPGLNAFVAQVPDAGVLVFVVGVSYPAVVLRAAAFRVWLRHRQVYRELRPLWILLHEAFPQDALDRQNRSLWHERLSPRRVHRRYWRRRVEIRDGLVRLSPHLADLDFSPEAPTSEQAEKLVAAVRREHAGTPPRSSAAVQVATPPRAGADADEEQLLGLARALS